MSDIPNSLTQCKEPREMKLGEYLTNTADLAKATGMDQVCVKQADLNVTNFTASGSAQAGWGAADVGFESTLTLTNQKMSEAGCGQFAMNINNQMNSVKDINCNIKSKQTSVSTQQVAGNSIELETIPRTKEENANLAELQKDLKELKQQAMLLLANPNITKDKLEIFLKLNETNQKDTKELINSYKRDIIISNSSIIQSIVQKQAGSISIQNEQVENIVKAQKVLAKVTAENKLAQELGVNALSPNSKSLIENNVENSSLFSNTNVENTVNSVQLKQIGTNSLRLLSAGNILIDKSTISQSIVQDLVIKALIGNASRSGIQIASEIMSEATGAIASDGKSKGLEAVLEEITKHNIGVIKAAKPSAGAGSIFAVIILIVIIVVFGAFKSSGSLMLNNAVFIVAIVSLIVGIVFFSKEGVGNKVLGSILFVVGLGGIGFGVMLKMRSSALSVM
jgi:hypothetical protein